MADTSKVVKEFFGDDSFPIEWESEEEKGLFWVYDDLHCPHPVSPMYLDIGGWWLTCDHMFRRFGTPFAADWIVKEVNGYVYTAAILADPDIRVGAHEYGNVYFPRVPKIDPEYAGKIGAYLGATLPVYGDNFVDWWEERLVPEMERNFAYLEDKIDDWEKYSLAEWAVFLEDAIDIHDRHWKIHWMLNFAQFSSTLALKGLMAEIRGEANDDLSGRLMQSDKDHNWDSIEALWKMKEAVAKDEVLSEAFSKDTGPEIYVALKETDEGQKFIDEMLYPWQREFGWHAVWSHEFIFPSRFEEPAPVLDIVREYIESDYDYPTALKAITDDIAAAMDEVLEGLEGEDLERMKAAAATQRKMGPLTPDHHFYIDQATNAHVRVVLICIGKKLVELGALDEADDVVFLRYQELRYLIGDPENFDGKGIVKQRKAEREAAYKTKPRDWIGTATEAQLEFPYLDLWGFPARLHIEQTEATDKVTGLAASPGIVEGTAKVVLSTDEFDLIEKGDILVCQMTNPAWTPLFTKISGLVTDAGGFTAHPAVLSREFAIPAVIGASVATTRIKTGDRVRVNGSTGEVEILS